MWFQPEVIERIQQAQAAKVETPESKARREAEKKIEEEGKAVCMFCEDEIWKNETVPGGGWVWESEILVGYCEKGGNQHKHKPLVKYSLEDGVTNA